MPIVLLASYEGTSTGIVAEGPRWNGVFRAHAFAYPSTHSNGVMTDLTNFSADGSACFWIPSKMGTMMFLPLSFGFREKSNSKVEVAGGVGALLVEQQTYPLIHM